MDISLAAITSMLDGQADHRDRNISLFHSKLENFAGLSSQGQLG
jgi:hypothetical protein